MSSADDILFEPLPPQWKKLANDIDNYIRTVGVTAKPMRLIYSMDRVRPEGSLTLHDMMRLYHDSGQKQFFIVSWGRFTRVLEPMMFDGTLQFHRYEDGLPPMLGNYSRHSIRDLNLVPNTYSLHYVFDTEEAARVYFKTL